MQQIDEQTVQNMVQIIKEQYKPCRIILFGSYARNEAGPDSDLDLLIVQEKPFDAQRSRIKEAAAIWRSLSGFLVSKDILLYSESEYLQYRDMRNHVVHMLQKNHGNCDLEYEIQDFYLHFSTLPGRG